MTEVERIYQENWLPKDFWEKKVSCDYTVSENMKKVWAIELDLYKEFARVCEKNNLSYFTDGGTTLGAIRHKGFIPWDDDIDVCMPRNSYEKLKELSKEFRHPYFLQNVYTDPSYGYSFMRLRNENTTVVVEPFTYCKFSQGIFIDIFPLDKVTKEDYLPRREKIYELIMKNSAYMRYDFPNKSERDKEVVARYYDSSLSPVDIFEKIEKLAMQDEEIETEYLSLLVSTQYEASKKIWPKRIFDDYIEKEFESIMVRVPVGYDEQLHLYFGHYMEFPPIEQRGMWHKTQFYPDIPYKEFYQEKYKFSYD
ncbi:MAG: LicD family protein [Lachnospiraceae bacterium]|nr:LicD family protein [Lachnospiraceae bacterium]